MEPVPLRESFALCKVFHRDPYRSVWVSEHVAAAVNCIKAFCLSYFRPSPQIVVVGLMEKRTSWDAIHNQGQHRDFRAEIIAPAVCFIRSCLPLLLLKGIIEVMKTFAGD